MSNRKTRQDFTPVQTMERGEAKESETKKSETKESETKKSEENKRRVKMNKWAIFFFPFFLEYSIIYDVISCNWKREYVLEYECCKR